ncbi:hypothetical protein HN419_06250 [Candidatus Woesearchaeota archaeon]|jgi:hypothetical protein|nr:hypothetical protein [Candidatus Woesearchaeota archaeon]MBT3538096.1 hypothetical protein [Candidatus Woesearchaeota archaeon]MBT4697283.1 hypothetical protein [Candidatus Woesearchaeota archaeon]MBT4717392.1 hypothetical protein [Candidatus Woesearchaeota archaeon]MBT7105765.1 hypothetical protein [Candidatus Woesearchaeota archaeon]
MSCELLEEMLTETFDIPADRASKAASKKTLDEFDDEFTKLENFVGFDNAVTIIQNGEFLNYRNGYMESYLSLVQQAHVKFIQESDNGWVEATDITPYVDSFYSLDSLRDFINPEDPFAVKTVPEEVAKKVLGRCALFQKSSTQSRNYLSSLIERGRVDIGKNEHWAKRNDSGTLNGPRGRDILVRLSYEMKTSFHGVGYEPPKVKIDFSKDQITVCDYSKDVLKEMRDIAYRNQK